MTIHAIRANLATSAAVALIIGVAFIPSALAQTKTWPAGTDCTKLVGQDKTDCANQAKNTNAPDNSNNPDNAAINPAKNGTATPSTGSDVPASQKYQGKDCTTLVGNEKDECARQNKQTGAPDNSNNPAQSN